ncbi:MAG TPA: CapA family protein [Chloroflexia bacterium]|nr:CapA family protein [Chloroflexia bacterium]
MSNKWVRQGGVVALLLVTMLVVSEWLSFPNNSSPDNQPPAPEPGLTMLAVGDIMLGRDVAQKSATEGPDYPFVQVQNLTRSADLVFGNLESPLVSAAHQHQVVSPDERYVFPAETEMSLALKRSGFNLLSLANNHIYDFGKAGVEDTLSALQSAGITSVGAGQQASEVRYLEQGGLKLAIVSATQVSPRQPEQAGSMINLFNQVELLNQIKEARAQADVVIVALHWGEEYSAIPDQSERNFARQAAEAGADLILGTHPHVIGNFEVINQKTVVAYSLGNFIFDSRFPPESQESVGLYLKLDKQGVASAIAIPLKIENDRPRPLLAQEREDGLKKLSQKADPAFQSEVVFWNGSEWQEGAALAYRREALSGGTINLPASQIRQVRDLIKDYGGYSTGKVVNDLNQEPRTDERIVLRNRQLSVWRPGQDGHWENIWQTPPGWEVEQFSFGDADEDGRPEVIFSLWKDDGKDDSGQMRSHPFVYGWRRNAFRPVWAGSALADPIKEFALADFDQDRHNELVVLEGNYADGRYAPARYVTLWRWMGWGYELLHRGAPGHYSDLDFVPNQPYAFFKRSE